MEELFSAGRKEKLQKFTIKHMTADVFLIYRLYERDCEGEDVVPKGKIYSLSITKIYYGGRKKEQKTFNDISRKSAEAQRIFKMMSRGRVTPCTAEEILCELIGT